MELETFVESITTQIPGVFALVAMILAIMVVGYALLRITSK